MRGLIGKKIGMTRIFNNEGLSVPVTVLDVGPCYVTQVKTIENDGTTTTVVNDTVKGRSTNAYFRDYLVKLKSTTSYPVQIRVERVTADSTESNLVNAFAFASATNIIFQQNAYPNTAHVALRFNAEQFADAFTQIN